MSVCILLRYKFNTYLLNLQEIESFKHVRKFHDMLWIPRYRMYIDGAILRTIPL